ncbi:hypothetical protein FB192DRAFT_1374664 [Mucor lusitanicus]|uniref:RxLR effector protein n=1 Tax=Mucor circinelloides f. lusitanicus TaxID=29924 RepID=A0A8H4BHV5_MUCCL|nr:hypothetical protein FB192DRAFT_1374664 [Mucor lusitanicus]
MHAKFLLAISLLVCVLGISNAAPSVARLQLNQVNDLIGKKLTKRRRASTNAPVVSNGTSGILGVPVLTHVNDVHILPPISL